MCGVVVWEIIARLLGVVFVGVGDVYGDDNLYLVMVDKIRESGIERTPSRALP